MEEGEVFKLPDGIKDPATEFDLLESLGRGSFGAVYKARHKKTGHIVAIKLVPVNEDFQEILKEINIMKQCRSKYVVQYYGNYFKEDTCWIIMEYCAMGSVSDMMNVTNQILNEEQIALVCYSVLKGLFYLHKNSKIHRDIKPGNILVNEHGECKLADFGVSGQLSERTRKRNTVIGTPFFLAPEVIQEVGYDSKADIWALGISAIEMAEFNPPYHDLHPMRVLFMIPTAEPPKLKENGKWSAEFSDFINVCLKKDQTQRPTAKDLLKHAFFEKKVKGTYVMSTLTDSADLIIERLGGREQALKVAAERKAKQSGEPFEFTQSSSISPMNSDDEEDLLEQNNKKHNEEQKNRGSANSSPSPYVNKNVSNISQPSGRPLSQPPSYNNNNNNSNSNYSPNQRPLSQPPPQSNNNNDLNELDSLLNGIILSGNNNNGNNNGNNNNNGGRAISQSLNVQQQYQQQSSSPNQQQQQQQYQPPRFSNSTGNLGQLYNDNNNNNNSKSPSAFSSPSLSHIQQQQQYQQQQSSPSSSAESSPVLPSNNFSRQLSHNSFMNISNTPNRGTTSNTSNKAPVSELDDLLEEMLNPAFGSKRGITPISSPSQSRRFNTATPPVPAVIRTSSVWTGISAGGCANHHTWRNNPQFLLRVESRTSLTITLQQHASNNVFHIGFYVARANPTQPERKLLQLARDNLVPGVDNSFLRSSKVSNRVTLEPGNYIIVPATFEPGQEGGFDLELTSDSSNDLLSTSITEVLPDRDWRKISDTSFEWRGNSAGGSFSGSSATWKDNPKFMFELAVGGQVTTILSKNDDVSRDTYIGFYVFRVADRNLPYVYLTGPNLITKTNFINSSEVTHQHTYEPGIYIVVPCTYDANQEGSFAISCFSDVPINRIDLKEKIITSRGRWSGDSAGGCLNHSTWRSNPQFLLSNTSATAPSRISIIMDQTAKESTLLQFAGFYVARAPSAQLDKKLYQIIPKDLIGNTEFINDYQVHYTLSLEPGQSCVVIPCTFAPNVEADFSMRFISSQQSLAMRALPEWHMRKFGGEWRGQSCGGRYSNTSSSWTLNPRFNFNVWQRGGIPSRYTIVLNQSDKPTNHGIGFYYFKIFPDGNLKELVCKSGFVSGKEVVVEGSANETIQGAVLPATFEPGIPDNFTLVIYSERDFDQN
ncbi:calpain-like cysteine protease [Cavenderia fasciculata]|uniref:non-specific serine/threonine protein kinase n=1 Tax=Cavenderia fasciculata TaxID=261658 RepID=F4PTP4_CACFS|nr:calpain-like cysteine protease [Cavenderia fasciculata]EGG21714.1 calpain-like cysteine protease [Cavenderia fasciculata]|eukprot:XP_004359564.1 calpain-like cysteine protease [Cavenderia fasciculata]